MKAAVLYEIGKPLEIIQNLQVPPLKKGQVHVAVEYSGVCHSQLMEITGGRGEDKYLPHMLGHEGFGKVLAVGDGVTKVSPGDEVIIGWIKGEGLDAPGGLYEHNGHIINSGSATTLADETIVAENRVVKLPTGFPPNLAALLGCALPTGLGLVFNEINPTEGSSIAVFGLGGIGLSALVAAKLSSPKHLIAIDVEESKLAIARELGATHTINSNESDPLEIIKSITGTGVDYSLEAAGSVHVIEQAFESVKENGGLCVFASHPRSEERIKLDPFSFHKGKQIKGSWGGSSFPDRDIPKFANLYTEGKIDLSSFISKEYFLDEINIALDDLQARKLVRALIKVR